RNQIEFHELRDAAATRHPRIENVADSCAVTPVQWRGHAICPIAWLDGTVKQQRFGGAQIARSVGARATVAASGSLQQNRRRPGDIRRGITRHSAWRSDIRLAAA